MPTHKQRVLPMKPVAKNFNTNHGLHTAMNDWAIQQDKKRLHVSVRYSDSATDLYIDSFDRARKEVKYKTLDGEVYTVDVDTSKIINTFLPGDYEMSVKDFKEAFTAWASKNLTAGVTVVSIKWALV